MATYDDPYNPIPRRLREPTPGYSQTRLPGTERTVVETPRGGFSPDPAPGLSERDLAPESYAMPFSPTRSMRYGPGDERDLGAPVVDPRSPLAPSPATWSGGVPRGSGRAAYSKNGGYAYTDAPAVPDQSTPRPLFSGVAGEDFEATRRRGEQVARLMRETDGPFANPNDWNYVRSYGPRAAAQAVAGGRANISGAPAELVSQERERFLRNRTTDLSISPQLRSAARDELAQIERDAAEERRREMWAAEQAARLEGARIAASVPVSFGAGAGAVQNADGGWDVSRPPEAPRPRNVQRRGDGSLIDGDTGDVISENPQPEGPDAIPLGGGGMGVKDPATGEWTIKEPTQKSAPVQTGRFRFEDNGITDTATGTRIELPPRDRKVVLQEMIDRATQQIIAKGDDPYGSGAKQIEILKAELRALSGEPDPTPAEAAEVKKKGWWGRLFSGSDEPASASAPAATAPAQPAPAPAAPASAPASPTGHRRWTPGA